MGDFDIVIGGGGIGGARLGAEVADRRRTLINEGETERGYHAAGRSAAFWLESYGGTKVALLSRASRAFLDRPPEEFAESGFLHARGAVHLSDGEWPEVPDRVEARQLDRHELERLVRGTWPCCTRALLEYRGAG